MKNLVLNKFLILLCFFPNFVTSQSHWIAVRQNFKDSLQFIKPSGELAFRLPYWIEPALEPKFSPLYLGNFYTVDFSAGKILVKEDSKVYFIDEKGQKLKSIDGSVNWISP